VWTEDSAARGCVSAPIGGERGFEPLFGLERGHPAEPVFDNPDQLKPGAREDAVGFGANLVEPLDRVTPPGGNRDALLRHHVFERRKPSRIRGPVPQ
jgi:hypothetical protein